ncbi:GNAT family N-acetyltransferase [Radiobacillus deserti]|uniref:GNAT family N-acetyltransferase n=1 Tax=Radiobacillus deserti TaxID=2594883 RepID=UPI002B1EC3CA|nr:GNAT family N-acetyltransferase [Radiobacillus deserti]
MMIRKATDSDAKGISKVHVESWKTTYRDILPHDYLEQLSYKDREQRWLDNMKNSSVFVAEDELGKIVGFANGGKERTGTYNVKGELYAIYLLKDYQRKGIGKKLLKAVTKELLKQNLTSMLVWVLRDNASREFYEKMGGK